MGVYRSYLELYGAEEFSAIRPEALAPEGGAAAAAGISPVKRYKYEIRISRTRGGPTVTQKAAAELKFQLDTRIYPIEAVQAAAYTFTDRAFVRISPDGASGLSIRFKAKAGVKDVEALSDAFHNNQLLHEALRLKVSQANQKLREYIVTKALVSAQETRNSLPPPSEASAAPAADSSAPLVDAALEKEIEALLSEIEKSESGAGDPLGVSVPWEQKHAAKKDAPAAQAKKKP